MIISKQFSAIILGLFFALLASGPPCAHSAGVGQVHESVDGWASYENIRYGYQFQLPNDFESRTENGLDKIDFDPNGNFHRFDSPVSLAHITIKSNESFSRDVLSKDFSSYGLGDAGWYGGPSSTYELFNINSACDSILILGNTSATFLETTFCGFDDEAKTRFIKAIVYRDQYNGTLEQDAAGLVSYTNRSHDFGLSFNGQDKEYQALFEHRNSVIISSAGQSPNDSLSISFMPAYLADRKTIWSDKYNSPEAYFKTEKIFGQTTQVVKRGYNNNGLSVFKITNGSYTYYVIPHPNNKEIIFRLSGDEKILERVVDSFRVLSVNAQAIITKQELTGDKTIESSTNTDDFITQPEQNQINNNDQKVVNQNTSKSIQKFVIIGLFFTVLIFIILFHIIIKKRRNSIN